MQWRIFVKGFLLALVIALVIGRLFPSVTNAMSTNTINSAMTRLISVRLRGARP